jgi:hypothetical protein
MKAVEQFRACRNTLSRSAVRPNAINGIASTSATLTTLLPIASPKATSGTPCDADVIATMNSGADVAKADRRCHHAAGDARAICQAYQAFDKEFAADSRAQAAEREQQKIVHWRISMFRRRKSRLLRTPVRSAKTSWRVPNSICCKASDDDHRCLRHDQRGQTKCEDDRPHLGGGRGKVQQVSHRRQIRRYCKQHRTEQERAP